MHTIPRIESRLVREPAPAYLPSTRATTPSAGAAIFRSFGLADSPREHGEGAPTAQQSTERTPDGWEVTRAVVVSTMHLSRDEAHRPAGQWPTYALEGEYGFLAYVGDAPSIDEAIAFTREHSSPEDWPGLRAVAAWAHARGFQWVRFDADADRIPGLPTFDW